MSKVNNKIVRHIKKSIKKSIKNLMVEDLEKSVKITKLS